MNQRVKKGFQWHVGIECGVKVVLQMTTYVRRKYANHYQSRPGDALYQMKAKNCMFADRATTLVSFVSRDQTDVFSMYYTQ